MTSDVNFLISALKSQGAAIEHHDFVRLLHDNKIEAYIDKNKAGFLYEAKSLLSERVRNQQATARTLALVASGVGLIAFFFAPWWLAIGIVIFGLAMFPRAQRLAAEGVLQECISNPYVYAVATAEGVLKITKR